MSRDITKLVLGSLKMHGNRYRLWDHVLHGLFFFARFDGNCERRCVGHEDGFVLLLSCCFSRWCKSESGRRPDAVIIDIVVNVHGVWLGQVLLR